MSAPDDPSRAEPSRAKRIFFGRTALWVRLLLVLGVAALLLRSLWSGVPGGETDDYGVVPEFALKNQRGETVHTRDLRGHPWVANFVFTRCPSVCPLLTAKFANLQRRVKDLADVRFVSISVDPEHDTPEVLARYGERYGADPARWWFLTGPLDAVEQTVVKGFKIHMGEPEVDPDDPTLFDIMHGEHFALVDSEGHIRGYFRADREGLAALEASLRQLSD